MISLLSSANIIIASYHAIEENGADLDYNGLWIEISGSIEKEVKYFYTLIGIQATIQQIGKHGMIRKILILLIMLTSMPLLADEVTYLTGKITFTKVQSENTPGIFSLSLGKMVLGKLNLFHELKGEQHLINGNAEFKNATDKTVFLVYYIALNDKKGRLVAATSGDLIVGESGNIHQFVSALMPIPQNQIELITSYQVILYESSKKIGT